MQSGAPAAVAAATAASFHICQPLQAAVDADAGPGSLLLLLVSIVETRESKCIRWLAIMISCALLLLLLLLFAKAGGRGKVDIHDDQSRIPRTMECFAFAFFCYCICLRAPASVTTSLQIYVLSFCESFRAAGTLQASEASTVRTLDACRGRMSRNK